MKNLLIATSCLLLSGFGYQYKIIIAEKTVQEKISDVTQKIRSNYDEMQMVISNSVAYNPVLFKKKVELENRDTTLVYGVDKYGETFLNIQIHAEANQKGAIFIDLGADGLNAKQPFGDFYFETNLINGSEINGQKVDFNHAYQTNHILKSYEDVLNKLLNSSKLSRNGKGIEKIMEETR
mgnify:CR=1 FL=1|tara:strand:+ start:13077 stop:13616 length:540 start_codon:yes stop_codon:yes gene_type:complete